MTGRISFPNFELIDNGLIMFKYRTSSTQYVVHLLTISSSSVTKMTTGLTKIEDLLSQDQYTWGTVKDTHPEVALANSVREDFQEIIRKQVRLANSAVWWNTDRVIRTLYGPELI